jgi:dienelactone hydrolase
MQTTHALKSARLGIACIAVLACAAASAAPRAEVVTWKDGSTTLSGYLVWDDASNAKRPGLLMVPNWHGVNAIAVAKAKMIAGQDYVILLADMYGKDVRPADDKASMEAVKPFHDNRKLMIQRVNAAWNTLTVQGSKAPIDMARLGAIGFCFGGSAVLDLARSGIVPSGGIVTFHGGLHPDDPAKAKNITSRLLVLNGADDQGAWPDIEPFFAEMRASGADWQFVNIGGAVHCFTETEANSPGCKFDAKAAARGYRLMHAFFDESFAKH